METIPRDEDKNWVDTSASVAPCLLGAAAGVFLGDLIQRKARGPVALALALAGVAALAPTLGITVKNKVSGPQTRRGSQRTLRSIREAGGYEEEEDQLYVG